MREVKYVPAPCEGEDSKFSGYVVLQAPSVIDCLNYSHLAQSKVEKDEKIPAVAAMIDATKGHYKEVSIQHVDGREFKSFEAMLYDMDCLPIMVDVAMKVVGGLKVEKK